MDTIVLILILIYVLIILISILELTSLSVAALIGALLTAWFGIQYGVFDYEGALGFIDFRLLILLMGTMIVVEVAKRGGLFNVLALYAIKFSKVATKNVDDLFKKLVKDFKVEADEAVQIINAMPESIQEIRVFLAGGRKIIETSKLEKILVVLKKYRKSE